jgi:hypothetical protein
MLPSQSKRLAELFHSLIETLRSKLSEIKEATDKHESAIRDASKAEQENRDEIPRIIGRIATAVEASNADVPAYEKTQRKKEYRLYWWSLLAASITAVSTTVAFIAAFHYARIAGDQLKEMRRTNCLTQKALANSDAALKQTLDKMQGQIDATNNYSVVAAGAYLTTMSTHVDGNLNTVFVGVTNIGHLAAVGKITIFEMTVSRGKTTKYTVGFPIGNKLDGYWSEATFRDATYASPPLIRFPLPGFTQGDYSQGKIAVITSGTLVYNDGFPTTPERTAPFCWINFQNLHTSQQDVISCDEMRITGRIKKAIAFPRNKVSQP